MTGLQVRFRRTTVVGLLVAEVLIFGYQGHVILDRPLVIVLIPVPLLLLSYGIFFVAHTMALA